MPSRAITSAIVARHARQNLGACKTWLASVVVVAGQFQVAAEPRRNEVGTIENIYRTYVVKSSDI
jgi:hypothetical protein